MCLGSDRPQTWTEPASHTSKTHRGILLPLWNLSRSLKATMQNQVLKPENKREKNEGTCSQWPPMWLQITSWCFHVALNTFYVTGCRCWGADARVLWSTSCSFSMSSGCIFMARSLSGLPHTSIDQWKPCRWHHFSWERGWRCEADSGSKSWGWGWMVVNKTRHSFLQHRPALPISTHVNSKWPATDEKSKVHA